jgi:glycosyltransferase involved in cell wall biosynthesis
VIASQIPENIELIQDGANGFLFDPASDPASLAERVLPLFQNQTTWNHLSAAARATIKTRFSWDRAANLYEQLLSQNEPQLNTDKDQPRMDANGHE